MSKISIQYSNERTRSSDINMHSIDEIAKIIQGQWVGEIKYVVEIFFETFDG